MANVPTPPAPPCMRAVPLLSEGSERSKEDTCGLMAWITVMPTSGRDAASVNDNSEGIFAMRFSSTQAS